MMAEFESVVSKDLSAENTKKVCNILDKYMKERSDQLTEHVADRDARNRLKSIKRAYGFGIVTHARNLARAALRKMKGRSSSP